MKYFFLGLLLFVEAVFYYQSKSDAKYRERRLFLISIPAYAYESDEVVSLRRGYEKENLRNYMIITLFSLPILFLSGLFNLIFMFIWFMILVIGANLALRKYRRLLKELKIKKQWVVTEDKKMHVDLKLTAYMENVKTNWWLLVIPLLINTCLAVVGFYYKQWVMGVMVLLMLLLLCIGSYFIAHLSNQTYTKDTNLNIQLNLARKQSYFMALWFLGCSDASFSLGLFLLDLSFELGLSCLSVSIVCMILMIIKILSFPRLKEQIIHLHEDQFYYQNVDEAWRVGLFGAVYDNPTDPRTFVSSPNGMQMTFNAAKPGYRYFILAVFMVLFILLGYIYGYPYYLDQRQELAELTLTTTTLRVDSPFYEHKWLIDSIEKVELVNDLGEGFRVNGTATGIYGKGHYHFDNYGDCEVYLATMHPTYIILYTEEGVFVVNDDEEEKTEVVYEQLLKKVR